MKGARAVERALRPIALIVLAAAAAAYAYFVDRRTVSDADRAARRHDVFPSFRVDQVTRVEVRTPAETLALERDADAGSPRVAWRMTSPRQERADAAAVERLLRELELATRLRELPAGEGDAGLDAPRATGTVAVGPLVYRFALGAEAHQPEGASTMRIEGEGTFVVARSLAAQLMKGADEYRDRTLVPYGASELAVLEARPARGAGFALRRSGVTFLVQGVAVRAARASLDRIFAALADARFESFLTDAEADRALGDAPLTVAVTPREGVGPRVEIRFGGPCPGHDEGIVAIRAAPERRSGCVARAAADAFATTSEALLDRALFVAHADEMAEVRIEGAAGSPVVDMARRGTGWHERSPEDRDLTGDDGDPASALARALADASGADVHAGPASAPFAASSRVRIVRAGGGTAETVEVGAPGPDGSALVRRLDDGAVLRVPTATARRLAPHAVALRGRAVWRAPFDAAQVVAVETTCGAVPERLELHQGTWTLRSPAGFAADAATASDLCRAMASAGAEAWITEADDGSFGLGAGSCALGAELEADGGTRRVSIVFGEAAGEGFYARANDDAAVLVAPAILRTLASRPAVDRGAFGVDVASLVGLTVTLGGERTVVHPGAEAGPDAELVAAVGGLRAEVALHTGRANEDEGFDHPTVEIHARTRGDGAAPGETVLLLGAPAKIDGVGGYYGRVGRVDATFFVPGSTVEGLVGAR